MERIKNQEKRGIENDGENIFFFNEVYKIMARIYFWKKGKKIKKKEV